jgi:hypothetical protein
MANEATIGEGATPVEVARRGVPIIYADLVASVGVSPHVSRIVFAVNAGDPKEGRQPVTSVVDIAMPTATLIEFCQNFLKHAGQSVDGLLQINDNIRRVLEQLKPPAK